MVGIESRKAERLAAGEGRLRLVPTARPIRAQEVHVIPLQLPDRTLVVCKQIAEGENGSRFLENTGP